MINLKVFIIDYCKWVSVLYGHDNLDNYGDRRTVAMILSYKYNVNPQIVEKLKYMNNVLGIKLYAKFFQHIMSVAYPNAKYSVHDIKQYYPNIIGHGTHSDSTKVLGSEHLSNTGDSRPPQYAVFYSAEKRVHVTNTEATSHEAATKEVNSNTEMLNNINMYKKLND